MFPRARIGWGLSEGFGVYNREIEEECLEAE